MYRFLFLCLALPTCAADWTVLDATDRAAIQTALRGLRMTITDLSFKKDHSVSIQTTAFARQFLHDPLHLATHGEFVAHQLSAVTNAAALVGLTMDHISPHALGRHSAGHPRELSAHFTNELPAVVIRAVKEVLGAARSVPLATNAVAAAAAFAVDTLHLDKDQAALAEWEQMGLPASVLRDLLTRSENLELQDNELAAPILDAGAQINWDELRDTFATIVTACETAASLLNAHTFAEPFYAETETEFGTIIVNNRSHVTFTNEAFLILDTGHHNTYLNSAGGANGLLGRPIALVIATGDNNQFVSRRSCSQGAGVFGIGILAALGSNATFVAKHVSQGAGLFGCGMLIAGPGRHTFTMDTLGQGAGYFGAGILWQHGGDSMYQARQMAQGFGGPGGCGLLLDSDGNDVYLAGGKERCDWLPGHYFSLAQGFGYGLRPWAGGGVGILCDAQGDDRYVADVYGQGASYWYATGLLLDGAGHDLYQAHQYCQGAGIHLSSGLFVDFAGDDQYTAHAICQGGAHDYAVGMLMDRAGNDTYTAISTAQGAAINTSFALLLDRAGNDFYAGRELTQSQAAGHDGGKREYGSIALLLDLGGADVYSQGQTNNMVWLKPWHGAGLDAEWKQESNDERRQEWMVGSRVAPSSSLPSFHSSNLPSASRTVDVHHPTERLLRLAISDKPDAAQAWAELKHLGTQALPYLLSRLDSPNVLLKAKVEELIDHLGTNAIPSLIAGIDHAANDEVARLCCYFLARFGPQGQAAIPRVLPLLDRENTCPVALYTLGHLRAQEVAAPALQSLTDEREMVRLRAAQALGRIGHRQAIPSLIGRLDDELWTVRYAAQDALIALGRSSIRPLRTAWATAPPRARPHMLAALARLGDRRALALARREYRLAPPPVRDAILAELQSATRRPAPY